jgi:uncharacterized protein
MAGSNAEAFAERKMSAMDVARSLCVDLLSILLVTPLVLFGLRGRLAIRLWKPLAASAVLVLSTNLATQLGSPLNGTLQWNWIGKLACVCVLAIFVALLPATLRRSSGIFNLPVRGSGRAILICSLLCASIGGLAAGAPGDTADAETVAYQLLMPSLAEEPVFRGVLPALLCAALGSPWRLGGASLGWWWVISALLFGLGHALTWSSQDALRFEPIPLVVTGVIGLFFGWLAARCGSVWPSVLCHSLVNATGPAIAVLWGPTTTG